MALVTVDRTHFESLILMFPALKSVISLKGCSGLTFSCSFLAGLFKLFNLFVGKVFVLVKRAFLSNCGLLVKNDFVVYRDCGMDNFDLSRNNFCLKREGKLICLPLKPH